MSLFRVRNEDAPGNQVEWVNKNGKIYNSTFTFKEDAPIEKKIAYLLKRKNICEEKECNRYELLMDECPKLNKLVFHVVVRRKTRS